MPFVSKIPNKCWWINTSILYTIIRYITINNMQHTAYLKKLTISAEHSDVCSINIMFEKYYFLLKECFTLHFNFLCPLHLLVASFVWEKKKTHIWVTQDFQSLALLILVLTWPKIMSCLHCAKTISWDFELSSWPHFFSSWPHFFFAHCKQIFFSFFLLMEFFLVLIYESGYVWPWILTCLLYICFSYHITIASIL